MLVILGGLPATGKTAIARELARQLGAVHVRIDTIEQALRHAGVTVWDHGYRVGYAAAEDNLRLGHTVVADSVNPLEITREAWRDVAKRRSHGGRSGDRLFRPRRASATRRRPTH